MTPSRTDHVAGRLVVVAMSTLSAAILAGCGNVEDLPVSAHTSSATAASSNARSHAGGQVIEVNGAQFQVPQDWSIEGGGTQRVTLSVPEDKSGISTGTGIVNADVTLAENIEVLAKGRANVAGGDAKRLPDVKFGGQRFFHLRELHGGIDSLDTYGTVIDGSEVTVAWGFNAKLATRHEIDGYINQVMPTFKFTG